MSRKPPRLIAARGSRRKKTSSSFQAAEVHILFPMGVAVSGMIIHAVPMIPFQATRPEVLNPMPVIMSRPMILDLGQ